MDSESVCEVLEDLPEVHEEENHVPAPTVVKDKRNWKHYITTLLYYMVHSIVMGIVSLYCNQTVQSGWTQYFVTFCKIFASNAYNSTKSLLGSLTTRKGIANATLKIVPEISYQAVQQTTNYGAVGILSWIGEKLFFGVFEFGRMAVHDTIDECTQSDLVSTAQLRFKSALELSLPVEGILCLIFIAYILYSYTCGELRFSKCRGNIVQRFTECLGASLASAGGAYVGTLYGPLVGGTSIGMVAGGMLGASLGTMAGKTVNSFYNWLALQVYIWFMKCLLYV